MFSIVMPVYDPFDRFVPTGALQYAVERVAALEGDFELIIVNNNPIERSPHLCGYLRTLPPRIKIVEAGKNLGTSGGFNAGLSKADSTSAYVVFMSADAELVDKGMLKRIEFALSEAPKIGIAHPVSVFEDNGEYNFSSEYQTGVHFQRLLANEKAELTGDKLRDVAQAVLSRSGILHPVSSFPLTFAVIRREIINSVGTFDEGVELVCHENNDLAYRTLRAGFGVGRLNGVFVNHRRALFSRLTRPDVDKPAMPHVAGLRQSTEWWNKKWGRPYDELYFEWRHGRFLLGLAKPYFMSKRMYQRVRSYKNRLNPTRS